MIYPQNYEQKIGFDRIRQMLSAACLSPMGVERVEAMAFSADIGVVERWLDETDDFVRVLREEDAFPCEFFFDVREPLQRARVHGLYLTEPELFDLRRSLDTVSNIVWFFRDDDDGPRDRPSPSVRYPALAALAQDALCFPGLIRRIDTIVDPYGHIRDTASPELRDIRREMASLSGSISRTLMTILHNAQSEGTVEKDVNPTLRDGRLVIPVAPALKRKLKGIVHDESATGKTVYIEPAEVVEANNRIRELEAEERREIVRILTAFADEMRPHIDDILGSYDFLGLIDFIRAKALMAIDFDAIRPLVADEPMLDWVMAVHPLLQQSLKRKGGAVVPLDIALADGRRILIISGPNAGGKSVCLKTVGLLQYMLQCGLLLPLKESSRCGLFADLFIDIGDEQSIDDALSTYSSHLLNMKNVMKHCGPRSLVLIDEFGSGTEPLIGGAMAEAVLRRIDAAGACGVITTHYGNLKQFADSHEGVVNGAMLYDRAEMRPLFQLQIGNPGSSFAVEIARKIGIPEEVIADASDIVGSEYIQSDKYLQDIVRDKRYWEQKRQTVHQKEKQLEELIARYEAELGELTGSRKQILREAKEEARQLISESNAQIENTIRAIREAQAERELTKAVRTDLRSYGERLEAESTAAETPGKRPAKERPAMAQPKTAPATKTSRELRVGDYVRIRGQQTVGQILELRGKAATLSMGQLKTTVKADRLELASADEAKAQEPKRAYTYISKETQLAITEKRLTFQQDLDVRGMRGVEAVQAVAYFIDDAAMLGINRVRILHGTGGGILRALIREYLATHSAVASFHDEHVQFGGAGITVVEL